MHSSDRLWEKCFVGRGAGDFRDGKRLEVDIASSRSRKVLKAQEDLEVRLGV